MSAVSTAAGSSGATSSSSSSGPSGSSECESDITVPSLLSRLKQAPLSSLNRKRKVSEKQQPQVVVVGSCMIDLIR